MLCHVPLRCVQGTGILGNGGSNHNITHNLIVNVGSAIGNIAESAATQYIHNLPKLDNGTACCRGMYDPQATTQSPSGSANGHAACVQQDRLHLQH